MLSELEKFAAYVKTAIQYQSPKMQQILQGALDQAWQAGQGVRAAPGAYRARLALATRRDARNVSRYNALRERPDEKLITRMFESGGKRGYPHFPPMPKPEMTRQLIFGAGDPPTWRRAAEMPRAWRHIERNPDQQGPFGLRQDIESLRWGLDLGGNREPNRSLEHKLNDPRIQRVIEHQAPGGVEQLRKHMLAARGEGPVPAFDIKKLRGG